MAMIYPKTYNKPENTSSEIVKDSDINVNLPERILSVTTGAILIYSGVKNLWQRPLGSIVKLGAGSTLLVVVLRGTARFMSGWAQIVPNRRLSILNIS